MTPRVRTFRCWNLFWVVGDSKSSKRLVIIFFRKMLSCSMSYRSRPIKVLYRPRVKFMFISRPVMSLFFIYRHGSRFFMCPYISYTLYTRFPYERVLIITLIVPRHGICCLNLLLASAVFLVFVAFEGRKGMKEN